MSAFQFMGGLIGHALQPYAHAFGGLLGPHPNPGQSAGAMYAPGPDGPIMTHPADQPGLLSAPPQMDAPPPAANTPMGFMNNVLGPAQQHAAPPMIQAPDMSQPFAFQNMANVPGGGQGQPTPGFRPINGFQALSGWG